MSLKFDQLPVEMVAHCLSYLANVECIMRCRLINRSCARAVQSSASWTGVWRCKVYWAEQGLVIEFNGTGQTYSVGALPDWMLRTLSSVHQLRVECCSAKCDLNQLAFVAISCMWPYPQKVSLSLHFELFTLEQYEGLRLFLDELKGRTNGINLNLESRFVSEDQSELVEQRTSALLSSVCDGALDVARLRYVQLPCTEPNQGVQQVLRFAQHSLEYLHLVLVDFPAATELAQSLNTNTARLQVLRLQSRCSKEGRFDLLQFYLSFQPRTLSELTVLQLNVKSPAYSLSQVCQLLTLLIEQSVNLSHVWIESSPLWTALDGVCLVRLLQEYMDVLCQGCHVESWLVHNQVDIDQCMAQLTSVKHYSITRTALRLNRKTIWLKIITKMSAKFCFVISFSSLNIHY